ncbi:hypothetical protein DSM3645_01711 [Blastopirellula marina DSM 3645]|uniref:Uncharacterized protein n=1 Tax=Blastopirellula marina DSM 3645 TaxID=314230 RepID=A4A2Y5_9BACT|nr:hypothetical protein DSM3645_01711 [Blastopirellula marina DSM 3645]
MQGDLHEQFGSGARALNYVQRVFRLMKSNDLRLASTEIRQQRAVKNQSRIPSGEISSPPIAVA